MPSIAGGAVLGTGIGDTVLHHASVFHFRRQGGMEARPDRYVIENLKRL
jgi:hypothetical protein